MMEAWKRTWRLGVVPLLSTAALEALRHALETDDPRLIQGGTTMPPSFLAAADWTVEAACSLAYGCWQGDGLMTVIEVEERFAEFCQGIDERLGEPAACRWFLNWHDEVPREEMIRELLPEVVLALGQRQAAEAAPDKEKR